MLTEDSKGELLTFGNEMQREVAGNKFDSKSNTPKF